MKFLSAETIASAWKTFKDAKVDNGFFGILQILKNITLEGEANISPFTTYAFLKSDVMNGLNSLFTFEDVTTKESSDKLYVLFPPDWASSILTKYLSGYKQPSLQIAIICLHDQNVEQENGKAPNATELVQMFKNVFNITDDVADQWLDKNIPYIELKFQDNRPSKQEKLRAITTTATSTTITISGKSQTKNAGELTSSGFFQTLYANMDKGPSCLLLSEFDFLRKYKLSALNNKKIGLRKSLFPHNRLVYGAPGTGKSYKLKIDYDNSSIFPSENIFRVTFYPDYTYGLFVGSYKPTPLYKETQETIFLSDKNTQSDKYEPIIDYTLSPGPFLNVLSKALRSIQTGVKLNYLLIIEEINRANAASVFGDVFQLLDRDVYGVSEYSITFNADISYWLTQTGVLGKNTIVCPDTGNILYEVSAEGRVFIRIPNNMFIWATMNSADQGVMPLDSAFKRRWSFEHQSLNDAQSIDQISDWKIILGNSLFNWNDVRKAINDVLIDAGLAEDRLLGPFILRKDELRQVESVKNKLLNYLKEDLSRHRRIPGLFNSNLKTFSDIKEAYANLNFASNDQESTTEVLKNLFGTDIVSSLAKMPNGLETVKTRTAISNSLDVG